MLPITIRCYVAVVLARQATRHHLDRLRAEAGQTSAEYALVLLGAATVAVLIALWAKNTEAVGNLLDSIFDAVGGMVE